MSNLETYVQLYLLHFIRFSICFATVKTLRGLLGFSGVFVLSAVGASYCFQLEQIPGTFENYGLSFFAQVAFGIILGAFISLLFEVIPFIGRLIDVFRGNQFAEQFAPELGSRDSQLEMYGGLFVICLYFKEEMFFRTIELFLRFNVLIKVPKEILSRPFNLRFLLNIFTDIFSFCILLSLPLILITFALEIAISIFQKINSKFQLGIELNLLRSGIGVLYLFLIILFSEETSIQILEFYEKFFV